MIYLFIRSKIKDIEFEKKLQNKIEDISKFVYSYQFNESFSLNFSNPKKIYYKILKEAFLKENVLLEND